MACKMAAVLEIVAARHFGGLGGRHFVRRGVPQPAVRKHPSGGAALECSPSENCSLFNRGVQERLPEDFGVLAGYAQGRREDTRLVPATKMLFVKAVTKQDWLGGRDSNPDTQIQSLQSYR
jgi:hypothetical protein